MLDHNDVRHKLSEYIDGSVTAEEKSSIEEHLKTCTACSDALHELQKTVEHIKSIEEVEPPAWMTRKIMTKVRSDVEEKKSLFQRFFFPLSVKLPIQAVAVLFLTVTAFYIYRNIQPAPAPSEGTMQEYTAKKKAPRAAAPAREQTISPKPPVRSKKVPQSPTYKSLDMKYEYEKPAPPVALDKAAESTLPAAPAPAPQARALLAVEEPKKIKLSLSALDAIRAAQDVEKVVAQLGGRVVKKTGNADAPTITVSLDSGRVKELNAKLRSVGELKDNEMLSVDYRGTLQIEIVILKTSPQP